MVSLAGPHTRSPPPNPTHRSSELNPQVRARVHARLSASRAQTPRHQRTPPQPDRAVQSPPAALASAREFLAAEAFALSRKPPRAPLTSIARRPDLVSDRQRAAARRQILRSVPRASCLVCYPMVAPARTAAHRCHVTPGAQETRTVS